MLDDVGRLRRVRGAAVHAATTGTGDGGVLGLHKAPATLAVLAAPQTTCYFLIEPLRHNHAVSLTRFAARLPLPVAEHVLCRRRALGNLSRHAKRHCSRCKDAEKPKALKQKITACKRISQPSNQATNQPTSQPTSQPANQPTSQPTQPTKESTNQPPHRDSLACWLPGLLVR